MGSSRLLSALSVLLFALFSACGGNGTYNPQAVKVTVSPASAAVAVNGQVALQASVDGLCSTCTEMINTWSVEENSADNCSWTTTAPTDPCLGGTIQYSGAGKLSAIYFAPSSPGTFHITAEWCMCAWSPIVTKDGTAVVTVR